MKQNLCKMNGFEFGSGKVESGKQPAFLAGVYRSVESMAVKAGRDQPQIGSQCAAMDFHWLFQLVKVEGENCAHREF